MAFSEALKAQVRRRAHFACCLCRDLYIEVHHIIPQADGGPDTEENAAPLCPSCHERLGANPTKRKFITEVRDWWYETCDQRYGPDPTTLQVINDRLDHVPSIDDLAAFKEEILSRLATSPELPRGDQEILAALEQLFDQVWYNRHHNLLYRVEHGITTVSDDVLAVARAAARTLEKKYGDADLGPWDDFEWGMINGKFSALRWVLGDEWDFLDT